MTNESKHTPAPWHAVFGSYTVDGGWFILPEGEENWQRNAIAEVHRPLANPADANLISAAPDLLESVLWWFSDSAPFDSMNKLDALISFLDAWDKKMGTQPDVQNELRDWAARATLAIAKARGAS